LGGERIMLTGQSYICPAKPNSSFTPSSATHSCENHAKAT
jgi:hypothetical protein